MVRKSALVGALVVVLAGLAYGAANENGFFKLEEICADPKAHEYCDEAGGCLLFSARSQEQFDKMLEQAFENGRTMGRLEATQEPTK